MISLGKVLSAFCPVALFAFTMSVAPAPRAADHSPGAALSDADLEKVFTWIGARTASFKQTYCYRDSNPRGVGVPMQCPASLEADAGLCYERCGAGMKGVGPVCWESCPAGFSDHGVGCGKPAAYGRGAGYAWKFGDGVDDAAMYRRCEADHGKGGCEKDGAVVYPKCKAGFHKVGCCICSPDCPSGMADSGATCLKRSAARGVGKPVSECAAGLQKDAALCYVGCKTGFHGIGPVCWQDCPLGKTACGAGCAESTSKCSSQTVDMILAPIAVAASMLGPMLRAGSASAKAADAISEAAAKGAEASAVVAAASEAFGKSYGATLDEQIGAESAAILAKQAPSQLSLTWVLGKWALANYALYVKDRKGMEETQKVLEAAGAADQTGITGVVAAYTNPKCFVDDPFPAVHWKY